VSGACRHGARPARGRHRLHNHRIADKFFLACETGKGWDGCEIYCLPGATFAA
jgi:hypothetical protein